jgi:hypothetical protein
MVPRDSRRSRFEEKAAATTKAAREILSAEVAARDAKTARLKAARLEAGRSTATVEKAKGFTKAPKGRK